MKKKQLVLGILLGCIFLLTGCGSQIPEMTEQEEAMVIQQAADLLLKYDANYQSQYLTEEEKKEALEKEAQKLAKAEEVKKIQEEKEAAKKEEVTPDKIEVVENPREGKLEELAEYAGFEGTELTYNGYELCDRYPNGEGSLYFSINPTEGNQLLVLKFNLANISSGSTEVDALKAGNSYKITVNDTLTCSALTTLLENDMTLYKGSLAMETGQELVLVVEIPDGTEVNSLVLDIRSSGRDVRKTVVLQ